MLMGHGGTPASQQAHVPRHPSQDVELIVDSAAPSEADLRPPRQHKPRCGSSIVEWCDGHRRYFDALAIFESLVAIFSGIIVWLGMWDLLDNHLLPDTFVSKLLVIIVSLVALYANRTLYDKTLLDLRDAERNRRAKLARQGIVVNGAAPDAPSGDPPGYGTPSSAGKHVHSSAPYTPAHAHANGNDATPPPLPVKPLFQRTPTAPFIAVQSTSEAVVAAASNAGLHADTMRRLYFDAPPFSAVKFGRASFALLASLSLWIGMWDLLDYHIIPAMFDVCVDDGPKCAYVKGGCVVVGLAGLYWTRALYGSDSYKNAHFSRMA
jgi:hypothetical protein